MGNQSSNAQQLNMMKQDIQSLFTQADQDHDGYLNQADFSSFIKSFVMLWGHNVPTEDKIKSLFTSNDSDNDGKLSRTDIDNMLLPEGHENISYDPNNLQGPPSLANSALANPFAKLDAAFGPPITGPPGHGPGLNSNPYQGLGGFPNLNPNQQFGQFGQNPPPNAQANPLGFNFPFGGQQNLQGQNANANPFGLGGFPANQANVNQNVQNNQGQNAPPGGQPLQNFMNQLVSGIGNAFQGLNLNTQQPGTSSTSQNQAPNASGLLSGLSNTMTDLLAMGASLSFNQADLDKDGFIGLDELGTLMNEKATMHGLPTYTNDQVQSQMDKYDQDGDGKLNLQEYQEMIKKGSNFFLNKPMHALMGGGPNQGGANVNPNQSVPEDVED